MFVVISSLPGNSCLFHHPLPHLSISNTKNTHITHTHIIQMVAEAWETDAYMQNSFNVIPSTDAAEKVWALTSQISLSLL